MITKLSSVVPILFITLGVVWLYPDEVYSQIGNQSGNQTGNQSGNQTGNCDPAYPNVCIKSPPPDLNCPDIPVTDFKVLPPDPHGFDTDGDGTGCETSEP